MKIAYFHRLDFEETEKRFKEEAEKLGIELTFIKYKELSLESVINKRQDTSNKQIPNNNSQTNDTNTTNCTNKILFQGQDIKDFDIWYVRSVGSELEWSKLLQLYARDNNIPVVDEYFLTEGVLKRFKSTMGYLLFKENIAYPRTVYLNTFKQVENFVQKLSVNREPLSVQPANPQTSQPANFIFPFIVKMSSGGRHGMGTFFIQNEESVAQLKAEIQKRKDFAIKNNKTIPNFRGFLIQEYIPNDGDFRVITVGYKCIGGFKRAVKEEKLVLNKSVGKSQNLLEVPADVVKLAEDAAKALQIEVAGTDLVRSKIDGKVYIVEVNEAPQFSVFERRTKLNVPKIVLNYLIRKSRQ